MNDTHVYKKTSEELGNKKSLRSTIEEQEKNKRDKNIIKGESR